MKNKIIFSILTLLFFFVYLKLMGWVWNRIFDIDPAMNVLALLILLVLVVPLSALSAQKSMDMIREN